MDKPIESSILRRLAQSPDLLTAISAGPGLSTLSAEALGDALHDHGLRLFSQSVEADGCRIELFCTHTKQLVELVLRTEVMDTPAGHGLSFLLLMPDTGIGDVQTAAGILGADICLLGRSWYALINRVSADSLMEYVRPGHARARNATTHFFRMAA